MRYYNGFADLRVHIRLCRTATDNDTRLRKKRWLLTLCPAAA